MNLGNMLVNNIFTPLWCVLMLCHPYYAISFLFMSVSIISAISKNLAGTNVPESTLQATCRYDYVLAFMLLVPLWENDISKSFSENDTAVSLSFSG